MNTPLIHPLVTAAHLDQLADCGLTIIDDALGGDQLAKLQTEATSQLGSFRTAHVHSGAQPKLRSDRIVWINEQQAAGSTFVNQLMTLAGQFNQQFYAGIHRIEAHYAHYPSGSFYAAHLDNPASSTHRVFSCVYYLHEHWESGFGGELEIEIDHCLELPNLEGTELTQLNHLRIHPLPGRLVIFDSNLSHSVLLSHFDRFSIAAWMRSDDE